MDVNKITEELEKTTKHMPEKGKKKRKPGE